ncbi:MAG: APC family permease [Bacillota bacterium]
MSMPLGGQKVFLRKASGLIKSAGTLDVFIYDTGLVSVGIGVATMVLFAGYIYPGGSIGWGSLIAGLLMTTIALGMLTWTITLPRSGGIYVFGTRSLWPPLAFTMSFVESVAWLYMTSVAAYWIITIGLGPALGTFGVLNSSQSLLNAAGTVASSGWSFVLGTIVLVISGWLLISGMKTYFITQKIAFTIAVAGSLLLTAILLFSDTAGFITNFNKYMASYFPGIADPYSHVIETAKAAGWQANIGMDWWKTLLLSNWAFMPFIGAAFSIAIGGEIRSVVKGQTIGILGAIAFCTAFFVLMGQLSVSVFGKEFLGAVSYNFYEGITAGAVPVEPWITFLVAILTGNPWIALIINLSFVAWIWLWIPGMHAYAERAMIAWDFDRFAPDNFGYVSDRTHTPINAIIVATIGTIILLAGYIFTPYFATVIMIEAAVAAWGVVLLGGIFFPYRKPHIYEKSPISTIKLFGIPIMSVACFIGSIGAAVAFFFLWSDSFAAGHTIYSLSVLGIIYLLGFLFYFVSFYKRKSQGIDIDKAFKEIPIE